MPTFRLYPIRIAPRWRTIVACSLLALAVGQPTARAEEAEANDTYLRRVKPILRERCYACHGALKQEAGLRLDTGASIIHGGDSGAVIEPGSPDASLLLQRISAEDESERMPPEGQPLSAEQIATVQQWIAQGAPWPADETPEADPRDHWAFQPPGRPAIDALQLAAAGGNPIDALLEAARAAHPAHEVLRPSGPAPRELLLRRVYLDLIGLPPTQEELDAFCRDDRPDAYERIVDRLLESPHYGERWARHWMDIWRYTDWFGLDQQLRNSQKHIWHWRDWIIESLNADVGYDQMIVEMLAGDELAPEDPATLRATGFLARNYYLFNRTTWLDETIEHTAKAFLGLTLNCSKCHDHKYDPLTHRDYYAWRAIFEPHQIRLDVVPGETNLEQDGIPRAFDAHPDAPTYIHRRGDEKQPIQDEVIQPAVPGFLAHIPFEPRPIDLPTTAHRPELQEFFWRDLRKEAQAQVEAARRELDAVASRTSSDSKSNAEAAGHDHDRVVAESGLQAALLRIDLVEDMHAAERLKDHGGPVAAAAQRAAARTAHRWEVAQARAELARAKRRAGLPDAPADAAQAVEVAAKRLSECEARLADAGTDYPVPRASIKALEGPDETEDSRFAPYPATTTGRRLALARWIVHADNPLTARVAVNHIWLRHFGQPLVEPVDDFGRRTAAPVQQPLLDWLAAEFVESGWRMKPLHRWIVTSRAYRMAGATTLASQAARAADPENRYYWHRPPVRMQSEVIRDSLLRLAGVLETKIGGPTVDPRRDEPPYRRSLYFTHSRDVQHALLSMFDHADIFRCYRRDESVVPQQALALANSRLSLLMSEQMARRFEQPLTGTDKAGAAHDASVDTTDTADTPTVSDEVFIERAYLNLLGRPPAETERQACRDALEQWRRSADEAVRQRARSNLVHALLNHNDFVTIR